MKVFVGSRDADDYGDGELFKLLIQPNNGNAIGFSAGHGEPEDNYLFRDLNFVYQIEPMLKAAYEAGKAGEPYELETKELGEDEY